MAYERLDFLYNILALCYPYSFNTLDSLGAHLLQLYHRYQYTGVLMFIISLLLGYSR